MMSYLSASPWQQTEQSEVSKWKGQVPQQHIGVVTTEDQVWGSYLIRIEGVIGQQGSSQRWGIVRQNLGTEMSGDTL